MNAKQTKNLALQRLGLQAEDLELRSLQELVLTYKDEDIAKMHWEAEKDYVDSNRKRVAEMTQQFEYHDVSEVERRWAMQDSQFANLTNFDEYDIRRALDYLKKVQKIALTSINCINNAQAIDQQINNLEGRIMQKDEIVNKNRWSRAIEYPTFIKTMNEKRLQSENTAEKLQRVAATNQTKFSTILQKSYDMADSKQREVIERFEKRNIMKLSSSVASQYSENQQVEQLRTNTGSLKRSNSQSAQDNSKLSQSRTSSQNKEREQQRKSYMELARQQFENSKQNYKAKLTQLQKQQTKTDENVKKAKEALLQLQQQRFEKHQQMTEAAQQKIKQAADRDIGRMSHTFQESLKEPVPTEIIERQKRYRKLDYASKLYQSRSPK